MRKGPFDPNLSALEGVRVAEFSLRRLARLPLRLRAFLILAAGSLLVAGCGLNDYETKMIQEHETLLYLDEQAKSLDVPVKFPERTEKEGVVRSKDVFIRPPKGIRVDPEKKGPPQYGTLLSQYLPSPRANTGSFKEVAVAASTKSMEDFKKDVIHAFGIDKDVSTSKLSVERGPGQTPLTFDQARIDASDGQHTFLIHFLRDPKIKLAVVFKLPKDDTQASKTMKLSLASVAVGANARQQWSSFKAPTTTGPASKAGPAPVRR
jgi:hypothetical protein